MQPMIQVMVIMVLMMYVQTKIPIMMMKMKHVSLVGLKVCCLFRKRFFSTSFALFLERLFQTFWKTQGHWYLSRRTLKLTRRTLGHYPVIKDELQTWLKELKSSKPLSETFTDATYLDQTQTPNLF
jgi:hypothetical protein